MDRVTHFHIPAQNMDRAKKFYKEIFDWDFVETGMSRDYTMAITVPIDENQMPTEPGAINGAIFQKERPDESPSVVMKVSDIQESIRKIEDAGGKIISPVETVEDFGLFAEVKDTEGNTIGLWQDLQGSKLFDV